jgi:hypothetical protein
LVPNSTGVVAFLTNDLAPQIVTPVVHSSLKVLEANSETMLARSATEFVVISYTRSALFLKVEKPVARTTLTRPS